MNCFEKQWNTVLALEIVLCVPEWTLCLNCLERNCFAYEADDLRNVIWNMKWKNSKELSIVVSVGRETSFPHTRCSVSSE